MPGHKSPTTTAAAAQELCDTGLIYPTSLSLNFISYKMVIIVPSDFLKNSLLAMPHSIWNLSSLTRD